MGKSAAQIRRLQARAAARGEKYVPPPPPEKKKETDPSENAQADSDDEAKLAAAKKLERALVELESNAGDSGGESKLNSKERRSAKRKAEAIAVAESGCATSEELMEWYESYGKKSNGGGGSNESRPKKKAKRGGDGDDDDPTSSMSDDDKRRYQVARTLHESLAGIEKDDKLNSKERRSAKRKAEAIASEQLQPDGGSSSTEELLAWYETVRPTSTEKESGKVSYNVFIGQLAFNTTKEGLFGHIQSTLGKDLITAESCQIRLLTDTKTKRSRGMAFVTLSSGELRYECLKLHLTYLDGRRINGKSKRPLLCPQKYHGGSHNN